MIKTTFRLMPLILVLALGSVSCMDMGAGGEDGEPGSGSGCGMSGGTCGKGTYWDGSKCQSKSKLCGSGTKYDASKDQCVTK